MKTLPVLLGVSLLGLGALGWLVASRSEVRSSTSRSKEGPPSEAKEERSALAAPGIGASRSSLPESVALEGSGFFALPAGRSFTHTFQADLVTRMSHRLSEEEAAQSVELRMQVGGRMTATVVAARAEELALRLTLADVAFDAQATAQQPVPDALAAVAAELEGTSHVRMARDGRTLGFRFPAGTRAETRNLVRSLWAALHCVIPAGDALPAWSIEEADATGPHRMDYAWLEKPEGTGTGRLSKARAALPGNDQPVQATGRGETTVDRDLRWPVRAEYAEEVRLAVREAGLGAEQSARYAFELVEHGTADVSSEELDWDAPWASASGSDERQDGAVASFHPSGRDPAESALSPLVLEIVNLLAAGQHDSRELYDAQLALAELLQHDPASLAALKELFLAGMLEGEAAMVVLAAVGMAQGAEAQAFLAAHLAEPTTPNDQRVFALQSAFQLAAPEPALLGTIQAAYSDALNDHAVRATALLTLGALSAREGSGSVLDFLLEREDEIESISDLVLWLEALGNSGAPGILPKVRSYLEHADARVRVSAVSALRHVAGAEPVPLLVRAATKDSDANVRAAAAELLAVRDSAEALQTVRLILQDDPSAMVRRRTLQSLASLTPRSDAVQSLLILSSTGDPDEGVRALALSILQG